MDEQTVWELGLNHKPYTPATKTDVMATWRRHGFVPPSEDQQYLDKFQYYRSLYLKEHQQCEPQLQQQPWF